MTFKNTLKVCSLSLMVLASTQAAKAADIVDTAVSAGSFETLVAAAKAGGLVETLKGPAPTPSSHRPTKPLRSCRPGPSRACCCPRTRRN